MDFVTTDDGTFAFLAFGKRPVGVIAIGQLPTGVIAIGQVARGFIAVGQLAVGVVVLGQLATGLFAIGQAVLAPAYGIAQLGIVGRGRGAVLALLPRRAAPRAETRPLAGEADLVEGRTARGWLAVREERGRLVTASGRDLGPATTRAPAGSLAEIAAEVVAVDDADFRSPARAVKLRVLDVRPPPPSRFLSGGLFGSAPSKDTPARTGELVMRFGAWLATLAALLVIEALAFGADG